MDVCKETCKCPVSDQELQTFWAELLDDITVADSSTVPLLDRTITKYRLALH